MGEAGGDVNVKSTGDCGGEVLEKAMGDRGDMGVSQGGDGAARGGERHR